MHIDLQNHTIYVDKDNVKKFIHICNLQVGDIEEVIILNTKIHIKLIDFYNYFLSLWCTQDYNKLNEHGKNFKFKIFKVMKFVSKTKISHLVLNILLKIIVS